MVKEQYFKRSWKAYSTLIGGFISLIFPGSMYITGNISPYIAIYYNVGKTEISNILVDILLLTLLSRPVGGLLI
jgi:hypothetical protein